MINTINSGCGSMTNGELFQVTMERQNKAPGGVILDSSRAVLAEIMRDYQGLSGQYDQTIKALAVNVLRGMDLSIVMKDVQENGAIPNWIASDADFCCGQSMYHTMLERRVKDGEAADLAHDMTVYGLKIYSLLPANIAEKFTWAAYNEWRKDNKVLIECNLSDTKLTPVRACLEDIKKHHLTHHVAGSGAVYSLDRFQEEAGDAWETHVQTNSADVAETYVSKQDSARIQALYGAILEEYGIKGGLIDEDGNLLENKLAMLLRRIRLEAASSPLLRETLKTLNLESAGVERVVGRIISRFSGKRNGDREKLAEVFNERTVAEDAALYQEELERARQGLDLTIRASARLTAGQKTGLSRIRNAARREAAGKKW